MTSLPQLKARQQDMVRELAHIASAQGASALARLLDTGGVLVDVPLVLPVQDWQLAAVLGGADVRVAAVTLGVEGDLSGRLCWALPEGDADRLGERLLRRARGGADGRSLTSALLEAANIVTSVAVASLGEQLRLSLSPSTPELQRTTVEALTRGDRWTLAVVARFTSTTGPGFAGWLVLQLEALHAAALLERLGP